MNSREKIMQARFSEGFEDAVMVSIHKMLTLSETLVSFSRWWIAASLILALLSGIYLQNTKQQKEDILSVENEYNYIAYAAMGDLL